LVFYSTVIIRYLAVFVYHLTTSFSGCCQGTGVYFFSIHPRITVKLLDFEKTTTGGWRHCQQVKKECTQISQIFEDLDGGAGRKSA
jgi:hypothetical protein